MSTMEQAGGSFSSSEQLELMRLIISCMRAASHIASTAQPTCDLEMAVCRVIALQARQPIQSVLSLWCGWRVVSLRKLRAHVARGDKSMIRERLSTLEWAVVDVLLLYDMAVLSETSYLQKQLEALERTFQLVQQFDLEPEGEASPELWRRAANCYSSHGVQLSAVALQRRWHELKLDTRQRACASSAPDARSMLPIHQAVANRYAHVAARAQPTWRQLVAAGRVAEPTAVPNPPPERPLRTAAPAPSEPSSSVPEKSNKIKTNSKHSKNGKIQYSSNETPVVIVPDRKPAGPSNTGKRKSKSKGKYPKKRKKEFHKSTVNVKVKPEITQIDDDTPSPKADVVKAMKEIDFRNVDATIVYQSDEEDVKTILDVQMGIDKDVDIAKNAKDSENLKTGVYNDSNINKITEQSKHKTITKRKAKSNLDDGNIMIVQSKDDSSVDNNTKGIENSEEPNLNIVITNVWSEKNVNKFNVRKPSADNVADTRRDSSNSETISVGSELDYGENYLAIKIAQYLGIWDLSKIDPKLLMLPVISLRRIDQTSLNKPPSSTPHLSTREPTPQVSSENSSKSSYSESFYETNKEFLEQCSPCEVSMRRLEGGKGRRVMLPDMETVRQNNRGILTAEVAPLVAEVAPLVAEVAPLVAEVAPLVAEVAPLVAGVESLVAEPPRPRQYGPARTKRRLHTPEDNQSSESTILLEKTSQCSLTQTLGAPEKRKTKKKGYSQYPLRHFNPTIYPFLPMNPSHHFNWVSPNDSLLQNSQYNFDKDQSLNVPYKDSISNPNLVQNFPQDSTHTNQPKTQDRSTPNIASRHISPHVATQNWSQNIQLPTTQIETNQQPSITLSQSQGITQEVDKESKEGILQNRNRTPEPSAPTLLTPKQEPVKLELSPIPSPQAIASSAYLDPICTLFNDDYPQMSKTEADDIKPALTTLRAPSPLNQSLNQSTSLLNALNPVLTDTPTIFTPIPNLTLQNPSLLETPLPSSPSAVKVKTEPRSRTPSPINLHSVKLEPTTPIPSEFALKTPKSEPKSRSPSPINLLTLKTEPIPNASTSVLSLQPSAPTSVLSLQPPAPTSTVSIQPHAPTLDAQTPLRPASIKTYTKKRSATKPPIKPCILGFALKQNVKKPVILNLRPTTQHTAVPLPPTPTRSEDHLIDEEAERDRVCEEEREFRDDHEERELRDDQEERELRDDQEERELRDDQEERELRDDDMPWRAQVEDQFCESDEFDLGITFAEAYFFYGINNDWD